jgi:ribonuclease D
MPQTQVKLYKKDLDQRALDNFLGTNIISIDCEMMGLNVARDRLCLVQISDRDRNVALVQIEKNQRSAVNLKKLLEQEGIIKLFHYARTDLAWLKYWLDIRVANVFCTKIASKLARTYTDKHGLKDLCKEVLGKELNKNQQGSDWGIEELSADQKQYAAYDVIHLFEIYDKLKSMLERENKMLLARSCVEFTHTLAELDSLGYVGVLEH